MNNFVLDIYGRFQVKKKQFFVNFITIVLFGAVGTLISCTIIASGISIILHLSFSLLIWETVCACTGCMCMAWWWGKMFICIDWRPRSICYNCKLGMLVAGVTQFFKKMDIGSLDTGDYLGTGFVSFFAQVS